jgi:hypothetical protein
MKPPSSSNEPVRPRTWAELGFERRKFVRWFNPVELLRAGLYTLLGSLFGSFADKREVQAALNRPDRARLKQYEDRTPTHDFWFDYVADIGDGFDATYSVAFLLAQETLPLAVDGKPEPTQRGRILLMGGDEVYPSASRKNYLDRSVGPYRAAFPFIADEARAPHLYAVPGNHDWYDGLSAFLRQFAQHDERWIGGWRTQQRRSYFARKLPVNYWLWGIDVQLHADIDSPQLGYFREAAKTLEPNDRVILATAEPSWVKEAEGDHAGYQSLLLLMGEVTARDARVVLVLTGDSHHYSRYVDASPSGGNETHFITAGGGGAFLHGTHTLPRRLRLPTSADPAERHVQRELQRAEPFPTASESRELIRRNIAFFPATNVAFAATWLLPWLWLGLLLWTGGAGLCDAEGRCGILDRLAPSLSGHALDELLLPLVGLAGAFLVLVAIRVLTGAPVEELAAADGQHRPRVEWRKYVDIALWTLIGVALTNVLISHGENPSPLRVLAASLSRDLSASMLVTFIPCANAAYVCRPYKKEWSLAGRIVLGLFHGALHVLFWLLFAALVALLCSSLELGAWLWLLLTPLLAAATSTLLFAGSLWFGGQYQRALLNDAFSAIGIEDYKNFLRFKITPDGSLHIYAIGLRQVVKKWRLNPRGAGSDPHVLPDGADPVPHVIERIVIPGRARHDAREENV